MPENVNVPDSVIALLKLREGFKTRVYHDTLNKLTVGMGHLLKPSEAAKYPHGSEVPMDVLNQWAREDASKAYRAALTQAATLNVSNSRFIDVLTSINFQLGILWINKFPNTWQLMLSHNWNGAIEAVKKSAWARQTPTRVADFIDAMERLIAT